MVRLRRGQYSVQSQVTSWRVIHAHVAPAKERFSKLVWWYHDCTSRCHFDHTWCNTWTTIHTDTYTPELATRLHVQISNIFFNFSLNSPLTGRSGLVVACLTAVHEVLGSNHAVDSCVYHKNPAVPRPSNLRGTVNEHQHSGWVIINGDGGCRR